MQVTKEMLLKKLKEIAAQKQQLFADLHACEGAEQTIGALLQELEKEEPVK